MADLTEPPVSNYLTNHDRAHFKTYACILDGVAAGADSVEIAHVVRPAAEHHCPLEARWRPCSLVSPLSFPWYSRAPQRRISPSLTAVSATPSC
jgi:hypothetical protein